MKRTILIGVLFLVPLAFVAIILQKVFEISMVVAAPLDALIPFERIAGIAFANILAIFLILLVCYLAGLIAHKGWFSKRLNKLDNILIDTLPGYAAIKGMISGVAGDEGQDALMKPVLVRFDDYEQIAFEVEHLGDKSVIFLPGSPSAGSGATVIVESHRVSPLDLPPHKAVSLLRVLGRGSLKVTQKQADRPQV
ncbi:hypothetical protein C1J03_06760 [Sulfitobacter sp. SK012]|uniref:hypothetical protein n=1 Tax=Sulfitobacter sp. SK012 TaxID=1389005 RepID=UPI000E0C3575|nr:hypothetical protein [Sulfitobacter sp. SK012]AXI45759.1 hypothetical protein C1J03_06760 [Sulfitobacter sp. SK012]